MSICQVANCSDKAYFVNDRSKLKYCRLHAHKLNYCIKVDAKITAKLIPIPGLIK